MSDSPSFADLTRRLDLALTVDLIATPAPLHLSSSPDVEIVRQQMAQTGFDILPCDKDIASYWVRPALLFADEDSPELRSLVPSDLLAAGTSIPELLRLMVNHGRAYYFVLHGARVTGLITHSDLNRRPARAALYTLVSELEEILIAAIERAHSEDREWLGWLSQKECDQVKRYRMRAVQTGVELNLVRYATLHQLSRILARPPVLSPALDHLLGPNWKDSIDATRQVRNTVAHPGNLLVTDPSSVRTLCSVYEFAAQAIGTLVSGWETSAR